MQSLQIIHLHSWLEGELENNGSYLYLLLFGLIAALLLVIALLNYINLSTTFSLGRVEEVGVRKVLGAKKGELVWQFMTESILLSCIAGLFAMPLLWFYLPVFNQLWEINLLVAQKWPMVVLSNVLLAFVTGQLGDVIRLLP